LSSQPGIGFSMHPRWAEMDGLAGFLEPLRQAGLDTLEFELDSRLPGWDGFQPLMENCDTLGMELSFHAAYRPPYRLQGFSSNRRGEVIAETLPMLQIAAGWAERKGRPLNVVIHGGVGVEAERESLLEDTIQALAWALEQFPGLRLAFENNNRPRPGQVKVGGSRAGVLEVVTRIDHPRLGICWDMGHDYLSGNQNPVEAQWLARVIHAHIHDVDEQGADHYPLVFGRVPYQRWLPLLKSQGPGTVLTLEIKGNQLQTWPPGRIRQALIDSFSAIRAGIQ